MLTVRFFSYTYYIIYLFTDQCLLQLILGSYNVNQIKTVLPSQILKELSLVLNTSKAQLAVSQTQNNDAGKR